MTRPLWCAALLLAFAGCGGINGIDSSLTSSGIDAAACTDTWADYGQGFFASNCDSCHQHSGQFASQGSVQASLSSIRSQLSTGRMPQGISLTSAERSRVLLYLDCGAQ